MGKLTSDKNVLVLGKTLIVLNIFTTRNVVNIWTTISVKAGRPIEVGIAVSVAADWLIVLGRGGEASAASVFTAISGHATVATTHS